MPGVRVGKGARLRRVIVEEDIIVPAGFDAGFDLERDRTHCTVTEAGVVVVSQTSKQAKPPVIPIERVVRFSADQSSRKAVTRASV
jgi:ADP-glucose pyrophosphorylase